MKILLLSPYDAKSHQYWWQGLKANLSEHEITVVTLAARYFSWRFRGNSLSFAFDERIRERYDLLIATSMTDLSSLRGMCPSLCSIPTIIYFHENQFAYPENPAEPDGKTSQMERLVERQITSIYSAISADELLFNSNFNRDTFLTGAAQLLARMPDAVPPGVIEKLAKKTSVQSVPLWQDTFAASCERKKAGPGQAQKCLNIVWNHRWEYDKGLDELETIINDIVTNLGPESVRVHVIGQSFRRIPPQLRGIKTSLHQHGSLGEFGYLDSRGDYLNLLRDSHVVLSTAIHEFQGIAVLEAIACGCIPLVPNALAYREFVPAQFRYDSCADAGTALISLADSFEADTMPAAPDVMQLSWDNQRLPWRRHIDRVQSEHNTGTKNA